VTHLPGSLARGRFRPVSAAAGFQGLMAGLVLLAICLTGQVAGAAALEKVTFMPQWLPQAQFVGYYVAQEKGIYRRHGLEVKILRGGPDRGGTDAMQNAKADFGTMFLATGIKKRAQGLKIVNIAQTGQRSAFLLVAKKNHGIHTPLDLMGKKVSLWDGDFQIQPRLFFQKYNLAVTVVPQSATLNLFLRDGVHAASAMRYNEYHLLLNAGVDPEELTVFAMADHGLDFPEDGIYCREETWRRHPERCRKFVAASLEGWREAFAHPEEALNIVMKYIMAAGVKTNRVHQKWMLEHMQKVIEPPKSGVSMGFLAPGDYERVAQALLSEQVIKIAPDYAAFYRDVLNHVEKRQSRR